MTALRTANTAAATLDRLREELTRLDPLVQANAINAQTLMMHVKRAMEDDDA